MPTIDTVRNGVPTDKLFGAVNKLSDPENVALAQFRFTATNQWVDGTHSVSTIGDWYGLGTDHEYPQAYELPLDHPTLGQGRGPAPQEQVLSALAGCITGGIATIAAARKIQLTKVESSVTGEIDVRGVLGIDDAVRRGFGAVSATFVVEGDAPAEDLQKLVADSVRLSAVYDMLSATVPVTVSAA